MNFVRFFNKIGDVDLAYRRTGSENLVGRGPFRKEYRIGNSNVPEENEKFPRYKDFRDRIRRLTDRRPWIVADWPKRTIKELNVAIAGDHYDFVLCRYAQDSYPFLKFHESLRKRIIIDFDDVISTSLFETQVRRAPGIYAGMKWHLQRKMLLSYQKRFLKFGAALFCSDEDRKEVAGPAGTSNAHLVPNTYPATMNLRAPDGSGYKNRRTLLFVGALDYGPNIDGLKWFIEGIFPKVKERYRDMRLLVVGRRPTEDVVVLCREQPGVELHSDVADVGSFYEKCGAAVVPLLSGGGTRIKILEAAMAGRPVFSTPLGMHGLDLGDGVQLSLFTDERSFLEQFQSIDDEKKYRERVANMYDAVNKVYSPAVFEMSMEKVLESILQGTMGGVVSCPADGHTTR